MWNIKYRIFGKRQFEKLEKLNLRSNKILNINILEKVNFNALKELDLSFNIISDISILGKVKFEKLKKLDLRSNNISIRFSHIIQDLKNKFKVYI